MSSKGTGSVAVVTAAGVIAHGPNKKLFFVASDRYKVLPDDSVLSSKLVNLQAAVQNGTFQEGEHPRVTVQGAHMHDYGVSPGAKLRCACKKGVCKNCKCSKAGEPCTSGCFTAS